MVSPAAKTRLATRSSKFMGNMPPKPHHPPWSDMITECITATPDGTKYGVSRPAIKKFVDSKYHLSMDAATTCQLNHAITRGILSGSFALPKGPSGKVKLAPNRLDEIANENERPKRAAVATIKDPPAVSTKTKAPFAEEQPWHTTRKYTSMAKKARISPISKRQVPPNHAADGTKTALTHSRATATRGAAKSKKRRDK